MKGYVRGHNKTFTMTETKQLTEDGFKHTTKDRTRPQVLAIVQKYLDKKNMNQIISNGWWQRFRSQHKNKTLRTAAHMWRNFCRHVVDIENNYWEKVGLMEDMVEELTIDTTEDSDEDSDNEEDLLDSDDRRLIDRMVRQKQLASPAAGPSTSSWRVCVPRFWCLPYVWLTRLSPSLLNNYSREFSFKIKAIV